MSRDSVIPAFLRRLRRAVREDRVEVSGKAEADAVRLGWLFDDVAAQLAEPTADEFLRTEEARRPDSRLVYVFCPTYWEGGYLWVRLAEKLVGGVIVVSFHLAEGDPWKP